MDKELEKFTLDELMKEVYRRSIYNAEESQKALDETMSEKIDLEKEIEKLNNIINEVKKWVDNHTILVYTKDAPRELVGTHELLHILYDEELKEGKE